MKKLRLTVEGETYEVVVEELADQPAPAVRRKGAASGKAQRWLPPVVEGAVAAPMPGNIMSINVKPGDVVKSGDILLVMESMKIETPIPSPRAGRVKEVRVAAGQFVKTRQPMMVLE